MPKFDITRDPTKSLMKECLELNPFKPWAPGSLNHWFIVGALKAGYLERVGNRMVTWTCSGVHETDKPYKAPPK